MFEVRIKVGRDIIWANDKDVLMDNHAIIQILTKQKFHGWSSQCLKISKTLFSKMLKKQYLYTNDDIQNSNPKTIVPVIYYKFDINKMVNSGEFEYRKVEQ